MDKPSQHVVPSRGRWAVRRTGAARATKIFATKGEAMEFAAVRARQAGAVLYVHDRDGMVRGRKSYAPTEERPGA
jgi:hypothetical protein